ncbi:MAG TPA: hemolysin III family protein [Acidimicrobiales bacterium]|nr:hemolysin III family protein [Acidimicrobiales bacterium]
MSDTLSGETPSAFVRPLFRGWLHVAGAIILAACSPILLVEASTWAQVGWILCYLVGVETMLVTSALFHRILWSPARRRILKRADHSAIFLAIAGSYLALAGLTMHGAIRLVLLLVVGGGAVVGIAIRQLALDTPKWANTLPYLVVGWAAVAVMPQIYRGGGPLCFSLVLGGGLAYTLGALAYAFKTPKLSPRVFGYHELFHAGTLVGAGLNFWALSVALR